MLGPSGHLQITEEAHSDQVVRRVVPVLEIAVNFVRENRWPILLLLIWIVLSALVFGGTDQRVAVDDLVFYVRQQALYIVVFTAFLASTAVNNERKSRRILLVLSKAISRGEYLL